MEETEIRQKSRLLINLKEIQTRTKQISRQLSDAPDVNRTRRPWQVAIADESPPKERLSGKQASKISQKQRQMNFFLFFFNSILCKY